MEWNPHTPQGGFPGTIGHQLAALRPMLSMSGVGATCVGQFQRLLQREKRRDVALPLTVNSTGNGIIMVTGHYGIFSY